jgi:predicted secreted protein
MLTSNQEILRRLGVLEQQVEDCKQEIESRSEEKRIDNEGYLIVKDKGKYSLVSKDFYYKALQSLVIANKKLGGNEK